MKSVFMLITNGGDGSNGIEWHKEMSNEKYESLEDKERYQSGDGVQIKELKFPDDFDLEAFVKVNHIYWYEEEEGID